MIKMLQKIMLIVAVITVAGHGIFPHIHHSEEEVAAKHKHHYGHVSGNHHHGEEEKSNDNQSGVLSVVPLDDNFIPGKAFTKKNEPPADFLLILTKQNFSGNFPLGNTSQFPRHKEFPPPDKHLSNLPSRAPPHTPLS